jgi:hypothetical protein
VTSDLIPSGRTKWTIPASISWFFGAIGCPHEQPSEVPFVTDIRLEHVPIMSTRVLAAAKEMHVRDKPAHDAAIASDRTCSGFGGNPAL